MKFACFSQKRTFHASFVVFTHKHAFDLLNMISVPGLEDFLGGHKCKLVIYTEVFPL